MESIDIEAIDLRHILDDPRWRAGASEELLRTPLARRLAMQERPADNAGEDDVKREIHSDFRNRHGNLVVLNEWIAERTRRNF